jgi:hypothetical protein
LGFGTFKVPTDPIFKAVFVGNVSTVQCVYAELQQVSMQRDDVKAKQPEKCQTKTSVSGMSRTIWVN